MIGSLLLAVDASEAATATADYARFLARTLSATLKTVYVIDARLVNMTYWTDYGAISVPSTTFSEEMNTLLQEQGKALLAKLERQAEAGGLRYESEIRTGMPASEILEAAKRADLIVIGRRGESGKLEEEGRLGAVAERVIRGSTQPVFVSADSFTPPTRVLLGYDGSSRAREAMVYAAELCQRLGLPMLAVSVHDDERIALEWLETVRTYMEGREPKLSTVPLSGDPVDAILSQAEPGDIIAMGAFGEGRVREWLLGSTTEAMLRATPLPLLLHR